MYQKIASSFFSHILIRENLTLPKMHTQAFLKSHISSAHTQEREGAMALMP